MRIGSLIVKNKGKWISEGIAEGNELPALVDRYREIVEKKGVLSTGKKGEVKISEMRLLATGISGGELKACRRFA